MQLSTSMRRPPVTCLPHATLAQVARTMDFEEVGSVVVLTDDGEIAMTGGPTTRPE
jgi:signal-transduction protein with cAMP-binding, CBS, and nucleotidyltransferase domain